MKYLISTLVFSIGLFCLLRASNNDWLTGLGMVLVLVSAAPQWNAKKPKPSSGQENVPQRENPN
jgi:hypothetical protein